MLLRLCIFLFCCEMWLFGKTVEGVATCVGHPFRGVQLAPVLNGLVNNDLIVDSAEVFNRNTVLYVVRRPG
jgi:hypothetical protein